MSLEDILNWNGWGLAGSILSFFGLIFAFTASRNARNAKQAAEQSAEEARRTITAVEAIHEFGNVQSKLREIANKIDGNIWDRASELLISINNSVTQVSNSSTFKCSSESRNLLAGFQSQIKTLNTTVLKAQHQSGPIDSVKVKKILFTQSESISAILAELKSGVN